MRMNGEPYKVVGVLPRGLRTARTRDRRTGAVRLYPAADVGRRTRERVQPDDRAAAPGRDDRGSQRSDANDRRDETSSGLPQSADFVKTSGFTGFARPIRQQLVGDTRVALLRPAGRCVSRSSHRVLQRREPAADARHRTRTRAGDPDDARRRPVAPGPADADRRRGALAVRARSRGSRSAWRASARCSPCRRRRSPDSRRRRSTCRCSPSRWCSAVVTGMVFGVVPAICGHSRQHHLAAQGRRDTRIGGTRDRLLPRRARRRRKSRSRWCCSSAPAC